jgi:hypothetical protein
MISLVVGCCFGAAVGVVVGEAVTTDDDLFVESLGEGSTDEPVDRERLARLFANVAKMLEVEKPKIRNLQHLVRVPEAIRENATLVMESRYEGYATAVDEFARNSEALVEQPHSRLLLYGTLMDGQRTCWMLDLYNQLVGNWGGGGAELRSILPSRVACGRFRTAAFRPRVVAILGDALVEQVFQRAEIEQLEVEVQELQELVDDLVGIEADEER